jgi:hypothetical protein
MALPARGLGSTDRDCTPLELVERGSLPTTVTPPAIAGIEGWRHEWAWCTGRGSRSSWDCEQDADSEYRKQ